MSVIGEQIKKYRIEKGITQEQLGQLVGVTTQAVSRWERGGTPDAEILPAVSEVLNVSLDALFGREEQNISENITRQICRMSRKEAFDFAFRICWALETGLLGNITQKAILADKNLMIPAITNDSDDDYFSKIIVNEGFSNVRISKDFRHFWFMSEPEGSIKDKLSKPEELRKVFELFADEDLLNILLFLYSLPNMPVAASLISMNTGLSINEVESCMNMLCDNKLTVHIAVATAEGKMNSYVFRPESFAVPLLCFADEILKKDPRPFMGAFERDKPLI